MNLTEPTSFDSSGFSRRIDARWWGVLAFTVAGVVGGAIVTSQQSRVYESTASVVVEPVGTGQSGPNLATEAQLVHSTAVATAAAELLHVDTRPDTLASHVAVGIPANASVLVIAYTAGSPTAARAGSDAFAQAYLRNRQDTATGELAGRLNAVNGRLQQLNGQLVQQNAQLAVTPSAQSAAKANLESLRTATVNQISTLATEANQLTTARVTPGRIIRTASLPSRPSGPNVPRNLGVGAAVGLLIGLAVAMLRQRLGRTVRRAADLPRHAGLPVLAMLPRRLLRQDLVAPFEAGGPVFDRLRNEILANLPATGRPGGLVIVMTGAGPGKVASLFAANLAAALARTGGETILLSTHLPEGPADSTPTTLVSRLFQVRPGPGLAELITGRAELADVTQPTPTSARLRVITMGWPTPGGPDGSGGWSQSRAMRDVVAALRQQAAYVVIEAPPTSAGADAQSLASLADAAIVAVELGHIRYAEVADAATQLRRVGAQVLGAVAVPHTSRTVTTPVRTEMAPEKVAGTIGRPRHPRSTSHPETGPSGDLNRPAVYGGARRSGPNRQRPADGPGVRVTAEHDLRVPTNGNGYPVNGTTNRGSCPANDTTARDNDAPTAVFQWIGSPDLPDQRPAPRPVPAHAAIPNSAIPNSATTNSATTNGAAAEAAPGGPVRREPPTGPGRLYRLPISPARRDATAMLAALTEDGPLDGVR